MRPTRKRGEADQPGGDQGPAVIRRHVVLENLMNEAVEFDVSEIFSAPRVALLASEAGLRGGYSIDCRWQDRITGKQWDLMQARDQAQLWGVLRRHPSRLLLASPPCTSFSALQRLRKTKMPEKQRREGLTLLEVAVKACRLQMWGGNHFILEHPAGADSWSVPCLKELCETNGGDDSRDRSVHVWPQES